MDRRRRTGRALVAVVAFALATSALSVASASADPPAGFVTRQGGHLELDGSAFRFTGINVYFANSDGTCAGPFGSGPRLDEALTLMGPGVTVMRAWFFQTMATTSGVRDWSRFDHTLAVAAAHGVKVVATLANQWADCEPASGYKDETWYATGYTQPDPGGTVSYRDFAAEVAARYRDDPTIMAWQLMNEAEVKPSLQGGCSPNAEALLESFATDVSGAIKAADPNHLVSLGTIGSGQCGGASDDYRAIHAIPTNDLCEFHDYDPTAAIPGDIWNGMQVRLDQCAQLGKPLFVGESGIRPIDVGGGLQQRAAVFREKLRAQFDAGAVGVLLWAWNETGTGQIDPASLDIRRSDPVLRVLAGAFDPGVTSIGAGDGHSCAVTADAGLMCWGDNWLGDLGDGTTEQRDRPVDVTGLGGNVAMVRGGESHTCAALTTGGVQCWGEDNEGQLGVGTTFTHSTTPRDVLGVSSAQAVAAEGDHACALLDGGNARCWGKSGDGQLGGGTPIGGAVPTPVDVQLSDIAALEAGWSHTCAATATGAAWCWGSNAAGQVGDGEDTNTSPRSTPVGVVGLDGGVVSIAPGMGHTCALTLSGVWCWGARSSGELGDGVTSSWPPQYTPVAVTGLPDGIQGLASGAHHTCAITAAGGLLCWGDNDYGQLGDGATNDSATPVPVTGLDHGVLEVAAGRRHTCALIDDGTVWCWGENQFGQLGRGPGPGSSVPVEVRFSAVDPDTPTGLGQFAGGGVTPIPIGGTIDGTSAVFRATVTHPDPVAMRLEVEVEPLGIPFDGTGLVQGPLVQSGSVSAATVTGLLRAGGYHWRARTVDELGLASGWVSFGGNAEEAADLRVEAPILFASTRAASTYDVFAMSPDGSGVTRLTANPGQDTRPWLSPDGSRVAFASNRDGDDEIFVMNVDGSGVVKLTKNAVVDRNPTWSGDGTRIAFESNRNGNFEIYAMNVDGAGIARLTTNASSDTQPAFSRDGTRIAFVSLRDGDSEIYAMNVDGSGLKKLTTNAGVSDVTPSWSADGTRIAFSSNRDGDFEIYTTDAATGAFVVKLTTNANVDQAPSWSRDGARIVFQSNRVSGNYDIFRMLADGTAVTRLTNHAKFDVAPAW